MYRAYMGKNKQTTLYFSEYLENYERQLYQFWLERQCLFSVVSILSKFLHFFTFAYLESMASYQKSDIVSRCFLLEEQSCQI